VKRPWWWVAFAIGLSAALGAVACLTHTTLGLERAQRRATLNAIHEERARLALWRIDSLLSPMIAEISARPYFAFQAFYPAERAYNRMLGEVRRGEVILPSPVLGLEQAHVLVYFQFDPDGNLSSPQVPGGEMRALAEKSYTTVARIDLAGRKLDAFAQRVRPSELATALNHTPATVVERPDGQIVVAGASADRQEINDAVDEPAQIADNEAVPHDDAPLAAQSKSAGKSRSRALTVAEAAQQLDTSSLSSSGGSFDYRMRSSNAGKLKWQQAEIQSALPAFAGLSAELMRPLWLNDDLIMARRVSIDGRDYLQGCCLDWRALRKQLIAEVQDLLPNADVAAARGPHSMYRVASLPLGLTLGRIPEDEETSSLPIRWLLVVVWSCVAIVGAAMAALLAGALNLSERRGAFVSAVTHEMRTPLTTFRLYADLLAGGMITDETERKNHLDTLRDEADRLAHLVENVLAFAQLERAAVPVTPTTFAAILAAGRERLNARARQAGFTLVEELDPNATDAPILADEQAVIRILFNLVDNAGKYARSAANRTLHVAVTRSGACVGCRVRDHGPGIAPDVAKRLFVAFAKSAAAPARSAPGVGLGLALSRRLARQMGGDLRHEQTRDGGACFVLTLPLDQPS
jgi:signal transduction histidine kinase